MKIRDFGVEIWMNRYENDCAFNLAETCVESLTIAELLEIAGREPGDVMQEMLSLKMTYGDIEGSHRLRSLVAGLHEKQKAENVVITHGTIGANALVHQTLVERGGRVISVLPTYQQHYSIPESIGADVQILKLRPENGFLPDLAELRRLAVPGTKLIAINNPNNPTGALMNRTMLEEIVEIARSCDAWLLSDEVYRGTDQSGSGSTEAIADLYEKGISTGGMSKAYSLAGLRLGWIVGPRALLDAVSIHRDYNTISVGMLDDLFAAIALENSATILERSQRITRTNLAILSDWVDGEPLISWIKPQSGTTALLKYDLPMASEPFCIRLLERTGVMLTPGSAMDMEGHLRIGYTNSESILREGLSLLSGFLAEEQAAAVGMRRLG